MADLPMNCRDIACFLYEVPAHGVAGIMGRVALDAGQAGYLLNTVLITRGLRRPSPWAQES